MLATNDKELAELVADYVIQKLPEMLIGCLPGDEADHNFRAPVGVVSRDDVDRGAMTQWLLREPSWRRAYQELSGADEVWILSDLIEAMLNNLGRPSSWLVHAFVYCETVAKDLREDARTSDSTA